MRLRLLVLLALVCAAAPGCGLVGGGGGTYHVTAYFREAIALYPHSKVKVMGINAGTVDKVTIEGSQVRVDMTVNDEVPLPRGVNATINALTVIGDRNVTLSPPWKQGDERVADGFVIPKEHTTTPVEPDEALKAFRDLAQAIDPKLITQLINAGATAFSGHEQSFNDLLGTTSTLSADLASQDDRIVKAADNLHRLAAVANDREQQLGHVIDGFSQASGMLADERGDIAGILTGSVRLVNAGSSLLSAYEGTLPDDLANLSRLGLALQANEGVFDDVFASFPTVAQGLVNAYDPASNTLLLGANIGPSVNGILSATLGRILDRLGLGDLFPCLAITNACS